MIARTQPLSDPAELAQALSAWMDGEALPEGLDSSQLLDWAAQDTQARADWQGWHLAGDVLRQTHADAQVRTARPVESAAWMAGLQHALAQTQVASAREDVLDEPAVLPQPARVEQFDIRRESANDGAGRWKLAAGFASVAAVALLGWNVWTVQPQSGSMAMLAQRPAAAEHTLDAAPQAQMVAQGDAAQLEPQLQAMVAAHAQIGGQSLLPELTVASMDAF